jgi:hypothetical protein
MLVAPVPAQLLSPTLLASTPMLTSTLTRKEVAQQATTDRRTLNRTKEVIEPATLLGLIEQPRG